MGPLGNICLQCDYFYVAFRTGEGRRVINPEVFYKIIGGDDERWCKRREILHHERYVFIRGLDKTHPKFKDLDDDETELINMFLARV